MRLKLVGLFWSPGEERVGKGEGRSGGRVERWCWVTFSAKALMVVQGPSVLAVGSSGGCSKFVSHRSHLKGDEVLKACSDSLCKDNGVTGAPG